MLIHQINHTNLKNINLIHSRTKNIKKGKKKTLSREKTFLT